MRKVYKIKKGRNFFEEVRSLERVDSCSEKFNFLSGFKHPLGVAETEDEVYFLPTGEDVKGIIDIIDYLSLVSIAIERGRKKDNQ